MTFGLRRRNVIIIGVAIVAWLARGPAAFAQVIDPPGEASLTAVASDTTKCSATDNAAIYQMGTMPSAMVSVSGTFSGTLSFKQSQDGKRWYAIAAVKQTDGSLVTTTTGTGLFSVANPGALQICVQMTSYTSGTAIVSASRGYSSVARVASSGGSGTPGGSDTQLQYNNAGAFGGISGATTNGTAVTLTSPVFVTPTLGVASATSVNKYTLTAPAAGATLTIADGKTFTASNTLTFTGTDGSTLNVGAGGTLGSNAFTSTAYVPTTTTVNGKALSGNITLTLASADFANQGTTTTILHGAAAGNPSFGAVVSADLNITTTTCTNQFLTAISATGTGTCTTDTLAGAQHANQGTTTTVLHGNGAGNPSFAAVSISADVSGLGTGVATFLGTPSSANLATALTDELDTGGHKAVFGTALTGTGANIATSTGTLTSGNCVKINAAGDFVDNGSTCAGSGGTPGGSDTQIQYNSSNAFAGSSDFTVDTTNHRYTNLNATTTLAMGLTTGESTSHRATFGYLNTTFSGSGVETADSAWIFSNGGLDLEIGGVIKFGSGGNVLRWTMDSSGNFLAGTDGGVSIGASGATRPDKLFLKTSIALGANLTFSATAPTISSGGCTSPAITGTATAFKITVGTSCTGVSTVAIGLPTAATGWSCFLNDVTTPATDAMFQTAQTTTTATFTNYARTTGLAADLGANDVLVGHCVAF